MNLHPGVTKGQ